MSKTTSIFAPFLNPNNMKKLFTLIICCFLFGNIFAQHLTFKGVPIDGTLQSFVQKMKEAGFQYEATENGSTILSGDFAGYKGCYVVVYTLQNKDLVSKIIAIFPEKDTWSDLVANYENLKDMLTEKYGAPSDQIERFNTTVYDDWDRIHAICDGEADWFSVFSTELGNLYLTFSKAPKPETASVLLIYSDKTNSDIIRQNAIDDL